MPRVKILRPHVDNYGSVQPGQVFDVPGPDRASELERLGFVQILRDDPTPEIVANVPDAGAVVKNVPAVKKARR